jgi:hypothetical protein
VTARLQGGDRAVRHAAAIGEDQPAAGPGRAVRRGGGARRPRHPVRLRHHDGRRCARRPSEDQTAQLGEERAGVVGHLDVRRHALALHAQPGVTPGPSSGADDADRIGRHRHQERGVVGVDRAGHHLHAGIEQSRVDARPRFGIGERRRQLHLGERLALTAPDPAHPAKGRAELRSEGAKALVVGAAVALDTRAGLERLPAAPRLAVDGPRSRLVGAEPSGGVQLPRPGGGLVARRPAEEAQRAAVGSVTGDRQLHHAPAVERQRRADDELVESGRREAQDVAPCVQCHLDERGRGQQRRAVDDVLGEVGRRLAIEPRLVRGLGGGQPTREERVAARLRRRRGRKPRRRRPDARRVRLTLPRRRRK